MRLIEIEVLGQDVELVSDRCWQAGAAGIWEVDDTVVRAGVEDGHLEAFLGQLADLEPRDVTATESVELSGRTVHIEAWGQPVEVWVPPTVFGDACHPTTRSCLEMLADVVRPNDSVLDVGCGTGVLSVAAAIGGAKVTALDVDEEAIRTTADNAVRNGVVVDASNTPLAEIDRRFDVVVCNMTVGALRPLVPHLVARTREGGTLILSGMLEDQWAEIRPDVGGEVTTTVIDDVWLTTRLTL